MDFLLNDGSVGTFNGSMPGDRMHDAEGWVRGTSLPFDLSHGGFHGPSGDVPILNPEDNPGIEIYFYSLFAHIPETQPEISAAEAAFNFSTNLPELTQTLFAGQDQIVSRVYETGTGDYFIDRDGDGAVDGHFTIDYDQMLLNVDFGNDHTGEYTYHLI